MDICTAIKRGYFRLIRFLIDLGENVNHLDEERRTPLILCAFIEDKRWQLGLAQTLLEKSASIGVRDRYGMNALHYACLYDCVQLVNLYLNAVDYNLNIGDKLGHSALFYAVNSGSIGAVRLMVNTLTKYGLTVDRANKYGVSPLMQAYKTKRFDIAKVLIDDGCADEDLRDIDGKSAKEMGEEFHQIFITEQEMGIRRARSALQNRAKSAPQRRLRKLVQDEDADKKVPILPMQRSANRLIRLCKDCDLRNDPAYMFNLTPMDLCSSDPKHKPLRDRPSRPSSASLQASWRNEFRYLYKHLEVKHTGSFREGSALLRSNSSSTEDAGDVVDGQGLRIPGDNRYDRRGSAISSKAPHKKLQQSERLTATTQFLKAQRGSGQSPMGRRPTSRQHNIPILKEP